MRKTLLVLCLLLGCKLSSFASHIVGGEFELIYISGNTYRLNLIIYFDEINGNPGAKFAPQPIAWIYRKSDNVALRSVNLPFQSEERVLYTIPECTDDNIVNTTRMVFSSTVVLSPQSFSDPEGYYIAWQRCCRNYNIQNIVSEDPNQGGEGAGQTFFLEIPPLMKNGERFINTSPQLFPPLSDYACVNRKFYADFQGTDVDGDSLVYSISEPLNTPSADPHPQPPSTAPYPIVNWTGNFGLDNIVNGAPDLEISQDGFLTVTPTLPGIFVFAVKCEEFRDGEKIGEVRRDFQMVIVDCPEPGDQPVVEVEEEDGSIYQEGDTLRFLADESKCVRFSVEDTKGGRVNLKLDPVGYNEQNFDIRVIGRSPGGDKLDAEVCFTDCPPSRDLPFQVDFIGLDATCPQPLQDTVRLTIAITPPDNELPVINHKEDTDANFSTTIFRNVTVREMAGGRKLVDLLGLDGNNDNMEFTIQPLGFDLEEVGMTIVEGVDAAGQLETSIDWNFDCQEFNFDTPQANLEGKSEYSLLVTLEDLDECLYEDPQLFELRMTIILPDNTRPDVFSTDLGSKAISYFRRTSVLESTIDFDVLGEDLDGDLVVMNAQGANFDLAAVGATFPAVDGSGGANATNVDSRFTWPLLCDNFNLAEQDSFRVYFFIEDFDKCEITNQDTLTVDFIIQPTPNTTPVITANLLNDFEVVNDTVNMFVDETLQISLIGTDFEGDSLLLEVLSDDGIMGYTFEGGVGRDQVNALFTWTPGCDVFTDDKFSESFELVFSIRDDNCSDPRANQISVFVNVKDLIEEGEFLPPNIFTPNGDDVNEFFGMYRLDKETLELTNILPVDNCAGVFEGVSVFNRWGKEVFSSVERDFRWYGDGVPAGVYFYYIKYTNREFQGSVSVVY